VNDKEGILRPLGVAFVIAIVFYFTFFAWIEHRRVEKGPWQITFRADSSGTPSLLLVESNLNLSGTITFPTQKIRPPNLWRTIQFSQEVTNLPFGQMIFQDPTFLPGTVTMSLFGHEVELLPRFLTIDQTKYPWQPTPDIQVR
jgi:hypothetical protein